MKVEAFVEKLSRSIGDRGQIVHVARLPAREARYGDLQSSLHPLLARRLASIGIQKLYTHQAMAIDTALQGRHLVVETSTASGKSLCYSVPVLNALISNPRKRALYLFPTKALAQDQFGKLQAMRMDRPRIGIYDGDTSQADRRSIRRNCDIIITNPDMLHMGMLPGHANWSDFFGNLAYVVIDELHSYRGVFGGHVASTIRRLRRICRHYGSAPQFIGASATIGNPEELMRRLTGVRGVVIDDDGSPSGEKWMVFWNPPYIGEGQRKSTNSEAAALFLECVRNGVRNITFTRARVVAELIYRYAKNALAEEPALAQRIMSYRGGYSPEQRREIEKGMFSGQLIGVTATNALELGIDIGNLDACIIAGYPGSIASTWQQAGRAGRGVSSSLAILVAANNPLDQFLMKHPEYLMDATNESVSIDPDNPYVLAEHLICAAYELPISELDLPLFGVEAHSALEAITASGEIAEQGGKFYWTGTGYPASKTNIRSASGDNFGIYDLANPQVILGTVEEARALPVLHKGAVYLHQGEAYVVERLDLDSRMAFVHKQDVDYYTVPRTFVDIRIKSESPSGPVPTGYSHLGVIEVTSQVTGYWRRALLTDINLETVDLDLPARTYETVGMWLTVASVPDALEGRKQGLEGGLHAVEHAMIGMMPLQVMCDRLDLGGASHPLHPDTGLPTIFIYDGYPGGVGITESSYPVIDHLLQMTTDAIKGCPCSEGCPSCIQSPKCGNNNHPLDKVSALILLDTLLGVHNPLNS